jgi:hypothetical protein
MLDLTRVCSCEIEGIKKDTKNCHLSNSVDLADRLSNGLKQLYTVSQQVMVK